jgi:hypothetical protein
LAKSGKEIIIQGVGAGTRTQCGVGGQTSFTCIRGPNPLLQMTYGTGNLPRITGITFLTDSGTSGCQNYSIAAVSIRGDNANVRIDNNRFDNINCGGLIVGTNGSGLNSYIRGVIDHNTFVNGTFLIHSLVLLHSSWGNVTSSAPSYGGAGENSWAQDSTVGL